MCVCVCVCVLYIYISWFRGLYVLYKSFNLAFQQLRLLAFPKLPILLYINLSMYFLLPLMLYMVGWKYVCVRLVVALPMYEWQCAFCVLLFRSHNY